MSPVDNRTGNRFPSGSQVVPGNRLDLPSELVPDPVPPYGDGNQFKGPTSQDRQTSNRRSGSRPSWLPDGPLTDLARPERCRRCAAPVLRALAEACDVRADPYAVGPADELRAVLAGRLTYGAWPRRFPKPRIQLVWRGVAQIRAERQPPHIVAEHRCDIPPPVGAPFVHPPVTERTMPDVPLF